MLNTVSRPQELSALLNPAFGALMVNAASVGHIKATEKGLPFLLAFLVFPIVLHKNTRDGMPRNTRTKMHSWIAEHAEIKAGFAKRAVSMSQYTREAIIFGVNHNVLQLGADGGIYGKRISKNKLSWDIKSETSDCVARAEFLGRWLGKMEDIESTYAMWGVQP